MNELFFEYLSISPQGRIESLQFIIDLANIAIRNQDNPQIAAETVEQAYKAREHAIKLLEEERRRKRGEKRCDEPCL